MTDLSTAAADGEQFTPTERFKVAGVDPETGKIWPELIPWGMANPGVTITSNAAGDTVLTVAENSTTARITTNPSGDTVLTVTGA